DLTVTGPVVSDDPECSGTKTYTWTYEDCTGETADWTYTYTIIFDPLQPIVPTDTLVNCYADIQLPTPPTVFDSCGEEIIPTGPDESTVPSCEGIVTYTWTYEDCAGGMQAYVHT